VYHTSATAAALFGNRVSGVNKDIAYVAQQLGLTLEHGSDAMYAATRRLLGSPARIVFRPAARRTGRVEPTTEDEDPELVAALRESERFDQERRAKASNVRVPFVREWSSIVRDASDPIVVGQPICCVCLEKRASICFVECNHQCMCDECVREVWTRSDVKHECPVCRNESVQVVRPIHSSTAAAAAVVDAGVDEDTFEPCPDNERPWKRRK
jgi:hypothetical protein